MEKCVLEAIAKKMALCDLGKSSFHEGAFTVLSSLLDDFGYTFVRCSNSFCILDSHSSVVCSVARCS